MMEDRCVICGKIIPEGRQVCPECERTAVSQDCPVIAKRVRVGSKEECNDQRKRTR